MTIPQPSRRGRLAKRRELPSKRAVGFHSGPTGFPSRPTRLGARWRPGGGRFKSLDLAQQIFHVDQLAQASDPHKGQL